MQVAGEGVEVDAHMTADKVVDQEALNSLVRCMEQPVVRARFLVDFLPIVTDVLNIHRGAVEVLRPALQCLYAGIREGWQVRRAAGLLCLFSTIASRFAAFATDVLLPV
jgi:hypothetical protein